MSSETQPAACSLQLATRLAYVIYTSGSTGKPKGVMVEHCPLVNRLNWMQKKYPIGAGDTILHKTPFTFDVSVWEIFWWSIVGARVCLLAPGGERDPKQMNEAIKKNRITVMHFVPSMLNIFLEYIKESGVKNIKYLSSLKQVIASGEALTVSMVRTFNRLLHKENGTLLANLYGPTEATIDVSFFDCPTVEEVEQVPIGKPIDNIQLLVLSKGNQLQPVGAAGELCIAGDGLARGYLNQPDLTAERFTGVHRSYRSYRTYISYRSYRTGDLARWLPEGNIEFLGRIDHQVKIRGNRIELGEIEAVLDKHPAIKESVVTAAADSPGDRHLCAYIVGKKSLTIEQLREHLEKALPDYMIPSYFVPIEKIPLTANGKVDRKSLPLPEPDKTIRISAKYEPPTNEIEEKLVILWQELLKKEKIGIHDNFFHLGGHSLKVMNLVAQIHKTFAVEIPMREIFDKPFAADIAKLIRDKEEKRKKLEQILQEIEGLSDDQVLELLK